MISNLKSVGQWSVENLATSGAPVVRIITDTIIQCASGNHYVMTNTASTFIATLPANPQVNDVVWISNFTGFLTGTILRNGNMIQGVADDVIFNITNATLKFKYISSSLGWISVD